MAIAAHRQNRTYLPPARRVPAVPVRPRTVPTEIPDRDYDVVVFENRFPSFAAGAALGDAPATPALFEHRPGPGRCEVVCFTSDHDASLRRPRRRAGAHGDRGLGRPHRASSAALPEVEQVFCFENRGEEIGVTLHHPHGQIYAYPFVTPAPATMLASGAGATTSAPAGYLCADILAAERADGSRVVVAGEHWTAFVPFAARWPVEVHLAPHRHVPDLAALDDDERDELAAVYLDLLRRLDRYYVTPTVRPSAALHRRLAPGAGAHRPRPRRACTCSCSRSCARPGKLKYLAGSGVRRGRLGQRRPPRGDRGPAARARLTESTRARNGRRRGRARRRRASRARPP